MLKRIKKITSYTGHARFLAECEDTDRYIARCDVADVPSPYRYSPSVEILRYQDKEVVWFETRHRHYEVFEVPRELLRFKSHDEATDWHVRCSRKMA